MPRNHNQTGRTKRASRFVMLEHYLLNSAAWKSLPVMARAAYIEIAQRYTPGNNGRIAMSCRTLAAVLSASRQTAQRTLDDLKDRGFIETVRESGFNVKSGARRAAEWRLTFYKCDVTGEPASKKFMRWQDGKVHFADPPKGQTGPTTGPVITPAQQYCRKLALS